MNPDSKALDHNPKIGKKYLKWLRVVPEMEKPVVSDSASSASPIPKCSNAKKRKADTLGPEKFKAKEEARQEG